MIIHYTRTMFMESRRKLAPIVLWRFCVWSDVVSLNSYIFLVRSHDALGKTGCEIYAKNNEFWIGYPFLKPVVETLVRMCLDLKFVHKMLRIWICDSSTKCFFLAFSTFLLELWLGPRIALCKRQNLDKIVNAIFKKYSNILGPYPIFQSLYRALPGQLHLQIEPVKTLTRPI